MNNHSEKRRLKGIVYNIITALASIILVLVVGEITLRAAYHISDTRGGNLQERLERSSNKDPDKSTETVNISGMVQASRYPDIVYELKPNFSGIFRGKSFSCNSFGMRDKEYEFEKGEGVFRIAGLGDSVMFGWGVGQEESYLEVLEKRLNESYSGQRFEVLNFAVPGYNTAIEAATFKHKALPFKPDLVVIQFINNDYGVPLFMHKPRNIFTLKRSYLLDFVCYRLNLNIPEDNVGLVPGDFRHADLNVEERNQILDQYLYMVGEKGFKKAMNNLARLTADKGIPVIIILGTSSARQAKIIKKTAKKHGFHLLKIKPYSEDYVKRNGIENTREARRKAIWISKADHHPNAAAHTIYADALIDQMKKMGLI